MGKIILRSIEEWIIEGILTKSLVEKIKELDNTYESNKI